MHRIRCFLMVENGDQNSKIALTSIMTYWQLFLRPTHVTIFKKKPLLVNIEK